LGDPVTAWFERRDAVDEFADADLDSFTEALLRDYTRPGEPGDKLRALTYATVCRTCLVDLDESSCCPGCGRLPHHHERRRAA
jgi:hypothetical protein